MVRVFAYNAVGEVVGQSRNTACFAGIGWDITDDTKYLGYGWSVAPISTPEEKELFEFVKQQWDFPKLMDGMSVDDWNNQKKVLMDIDQYSLWEIFNHFAMLRYIDHRADIKEFPTYFAKYRQLSIKPIQAFILTNLYGLTEGRYGQWNCNHTFFAKTFKPIGGMEHIQSSEDWRKVWPKGLPPARLTRNQFWSQTSKEFSGVSPWWHTNHSIFKLPVGNAPRELNEEAQTLLFPTTHGEIFKDMK